MQIPADQILATATLAGNRSAPDGKPSAKDAEGADFMSFLIPPEPMPTPANTEIEPQNASDDPADADADADADDPDAALVAPVAVQADPGQVRAPTDTDTALDSLTGPSRIDTAAPPPRHDAPEAPKADGTTAQAAGPRPLANAQVDGMHPDSALAAKPDEPTETAPEPLPEAASTRVKTAPATTAQATAAMAATWEAAAQAGARKAPKQSESRVDAAPPDIADAPAAAEAPKLPAPGHAQAQLTDLQTKPDGSAQAAVARVSGDAAPDAVPGSRIDAPQPLNDARPAGPAATLPAAGPADQTPRLSPQIVDAIRQTRDGTVDLSLSPEELGRVRLVLHGTDASIQVSVQTERPETLDLLRRHIGQLQADLTALGYKDVAFNFGQAGAGNTGSAIPVDATALSGDDPADLPAAAQPVARNSAGASRRLDLRL